jgi:serine/threonine protein kinase
MPTLKPGDRVNNYLLEAQVGAGSFAEVWRARHHVFNDVVAIKIATDTQYVRYFREEGVVVHGLQHPNIVRALDIDPYADPPYLIMEYVDGPSLRQVLQAFPHGLPIPVAVEILRGVLTALEYAHAAGLVHRDIKPENVLLQRALPDLSAVRECDVKVVDFGLGRTCGITTASLMQSGSLITESGRNIAGTLAYMAPEQQTSAEIDGRSDLFACAIVLFEMLTGVRPEGTEVPSTLRAEVPAALDEVFRRAYTRLERRYASAAEMRADLPGGRAGVGPAGRPPAAAARGRETACPSCQGRVRPGDQFCMHCGTQLVEAVPRCQACQAFVNQADHYCILCGADLRIRAR